MNRSVKTLVFWTVILMAAFLLWQVVRSDAPGNQRNNEISYSRFISEVEAGDVAKIKISGTHIRGQFRDGKTFELTGPANPGIYLDLLRQKGVEIWFGDTTSDSLPLQLLGTWAPLILLGALWLFMIRQLRRRGSTSAGGPSNASVGSM